MTRKRQLALPGTLRRPAPPVARAMRDLKADEFARVLTRHGMRRVGDLHFVVPPDERPIEAVCRVNPIRIARRATLAKLLRTRKDGLCPAGSSSC